MSIRTAKVGRSQRPQFALYLAVSNTDPRMPARLHELFGGSLVNKTGNQIRRPIFEWRVFASNAGSILRLLRPYLVIKGEQADIAIAFAETLRRTGGHRAEVHDAREEMRKKIRLLKTEAVS